MRVRTRASEGTGEGTRPYTSRFAPTRGYPSAALWMLILHGRTSKQRGARRGVRGDGYHVGRRTGSARETEKSVRLLSEIARLTREERCARCSAIWIREKGMQERERERERKKRERRKVRLHGVMQGPTRTRQGEALAHFDSGSLSPSPSLCAVDYSEASLSLDHHYRARAWRALQLTSRGTTTNATCCER